MNGKKLVMEVSAWAWYNNVLSLGGVRPRSWLPLKELARIAEALGRPITLQELQALVQTDGPMEKCYSCGAEFQPVRVVRLTKWFMDRLYSGKVNILAMDIPLDIGSFVVRRNGNGDLIRRAHCGPLFFYNPEAKDADGCERFCPNMKSCIGKAYRAKDNLDTSGRAYCTHSLKSASAMVKADADIRRAKQKPTEVKPTKKKYQHRELVRVGSVFSEAVRAAS